MDNPNIKRVKKLAASISGINRFETECLTLTLHELSQQKAKEPIKTNQNLLKKVKI